MKKISLLSSIFCAPAILRTIRARRLQAALAVGFTLTILLLQAILTKIMVGN